MSEIKPVGWLGRCDDQVCDAVAVMVVGHCPAGAVECECGAYLYWQAVVTVGQIRQMVEQVRKRYDYEVAMHNAATNAALDAILAQLPGGD